MCTLSAEGDDRRLSLLAGEEKHVFLRFADSSGAPLAAEAVDLSLAPLDPSTPEARCGFVLGGLEPANEGNGRYRVSVLVTRAGSYRLHGRLRRSGVELAGSPLLIHVSAARAHALSSLLAAAGADGRVLEADSVLEQPAGGTGTLTIRAFDRFGNACPRGGERFVAEVVRGEDGTGLVSVGVQDSGDGSYHVRWRGEAAGGYVLHVLLRGSAVRGSPVKLAVRPLAADRATSAVRVSGVGGLAAADEGTVVLDVRDRFGNTVPAKPTVSFELTLRRVADGSFVEVERRGARWTADGCYELRFACALAGSFQLGVSCTQARAADVRGSA